MAHKVENHKTQQSNLSRRADIRSAFPNAGNSDEEVIYHTRRDGSTYQIRTIEDPHTTMKKVLDDVLNVEKRSFLVYNTIRDYQGYEIIAARLKRDTSLLQMSEIPHVCGINNTRMSEAMAIVVRKAMAMLLDKSLEEAHDDIRHMYESAVSVVASLTGSSKEDIKEKNHTASRVISQLLVLDKYLMFAKESQPLQPDLRFLQLQMLTEACMANLEKNGISNESCSEVYSALTIAADVATGLLGDKHGCTIGLKNCAQDIREQILQCATEKPLGHTGSDASQAITLDHGDIYSALPSVPPSPDEAMTSYLNATEDYLCEKGQSRRAEIINHYNSHAGTYSNTPLKFLKPNVDHFKKMQPKPFFDRLSGLLSALASIENPIDYAQPFDHHLPHPPGRTSCLMHACPDSWHTLKVAYNALLLVNELLKSGYRTDAIYNKVLELCSSLSSAREINGFTSVVYSLVRLHLIESGAFLKSGQDFGKDVTALPPDGSDSSAQSAMQQRQDEPGIRPFPEYKLRGLEMPELQPLKNTGQLRTYLEQSNLALECISKTVEDRKTRMEEMSDSEHRLLADINAASEAVNSTIAIISATESNSNQQALFMMQVMVADLQENLERTQKKDAIKEYQKRATPLIRACSNKLLSLHNVDETVRVCAENIINLAKETILIKSEPAHGEHSPTHRSASETQVATLSNSAASPLRQSEPIPSSIAANLKQCKKLVDRLENIVNVECPIRSAESVIRNFKLAFSRVAHAKSLCVDADAYCTSLKSASSIILGALTTIGSLKPPVSVTASMTLLNSIKRCANMLDIALQNALIEETCTHRKTLLLQAQKSAAEALNTLKYVDTNSEVIKGYSIAKIARDAFESCRRDLSTVHSFQATESERAADTGASSRTYNLHLQAALSANISIIALLTQHATSWSKDASREHLGKGPTLCDITKRETLLLNLYEALQSMQRASRCFEEDPPTALLDSCKDLERLINTHVFAGIAFTDPEKGAKSIDKIYARAPRLLELVQESQECEPSKTAAMEAIKQASVLLKRSSYALKKEVGYPQALYSEGSGIAAFPSEISDLTVRQKDTCDPQLIDIVESGQQSSLSRWFCKTIVSLKQALFPSALSEDEISNSIKGSVESIGLLLENMRQYSSQNTSAKAQPWKNMDSFCSRSLELAKLSLKSKRYTDILNAECHCIGSISTIDSEKSLPPIKHSKVQLKQIAQLRNEISFLRKELHAYAENRKSSGETQPQYTDLYTSWDTLSAAWWQHNRGLVGLKQVVKEMKSVYGRNVSIKAPVELLETLFEQQDWESIDFICNNCIVCSANGDAVHQEVFDLFQRNLRNELNGHSDFPVAIKPQGFVDKIMTLFRKETPKSRDDVPLFLKALIKNSCSKNTYSTGDYYYQLPRCKIDSMISSLYAVPENHHIAAFLLYSCSGGSLNTSTLVKCQSTETIYGFFNNNQEFHNVTSGIQEASWKSEQYPPATNHALVSRKARHLYAATLKGFLPAKARKQLSITQKLFSKIRFLGKNTAPQNRAQTFHSHPLKREQRKIVLNGVDILTGEVYYPAEANSDGSTQCADLQGIAAEPHGIRAASTNSMSPPTFSPTSSFSSTPIFFDSIANSITPTTEEGSINSIHFVGTLSEIAAPSQSGKRSRKVLTVSSNCGTGKQQGVSAEQGNNGGFGGPAKLVITLSTCTQSSEVLEKSEAGSQVRCEAGSTIITELPRTHFDEEKENERKEIDSAQPSTVFTSGCIVSRHGAREHKVDMGERRL
ncbi:hypothetical protein ANPL_02975 [Anaplasma platys]|uniref:Uncharacterized protein n=1 Tax=Anaplasma platys TaxID=949 RepID=A0A858PYK7_9RICK|nr:hypothetical protein [Anaplasma platys]QJC27652.1 hypothetical protein ANPL_02975 [Anaplasma platys]